MKSWPREKRPATIAVMQNSSRLPLRRVDRSIRNRRAKSVELVLQPSGRTIALGSGKSLRIVASGPASGDLEIEWSSDRCEVFPWPGASIELRSGKALVAREETVPRLPEGMTTREWCRELVSL